MSPYAMSIGEPENSQDTPFPNTTPAGKRKVNLGARPGPSKKAKPRKPNQCQALVQVMVMCRRLEDGYDPNYLRVDEDLSDMDQDVSNQTNMEKDLKKEEAYIREAKQDNDELLMLIQQLEEKSNASKQSNDLVNAKVTDSGTRFGSKQRRSVDIDMPDYDPHSNDMVVRECLKTHSERAQDLQFALENNETVKQELEDLRKDMNQARTDFAAQVRDMREQLRLEYHGRLSQQREELEERAQRRKAKFNQELNEKQTVIHEMTANLSRSHRIELENSARVGKFAADREIEELRVDLLETEHELGKARQAEKGLKEELSLQESMHEEDLLARKRVYDKLQAKLEREEISHKEVERSLQKKFDESEYLQDRYADLLIKQYAKRGGLREQIRRLKSSLEGTVTAATVQMMQLEVARREKVFLLASVASAKSRIDGLKSEVDVCTDTLSDKQATIQELESLQRKTDQDLRSEKVLSKKYTLQIKDLREWSSQASQKIQRLSADNTTLTQSVERKHQRLERRQEEITVLDDATTELKKQVKRQHDLLSLKATTLSEHEQEIKKLNGQKADSARELAAQISLVAQRTRRNDELEKSIDKLNDTVVKLDSNLDHNAFELNSNASTIRSKEKRIRELDRAVQDGREANNNILMAMREVERDQLSLSSDLSNKNTELRSQVALVDQRDAEIRDLEASVSSLSQAQTFSTEKIDSLETELSRLRIELASKDEILASQASAATLKDGQIEKLGAINTRLSEAQTASTINVDSLRTRVSELTLSVQAKTEALGSQTSAAIFQDANIRRLEASNADLLRLQEKTEKENTFLRDALENADGRSTALETTLKNRGEELRAANETIEHRRRKLEDLENDLLRAQDEAENDKACLQSRLTTANNTLDDLDAKLKSRDMELRDAKEAIEDTRGRLGEVEKELSAEQDSNETASLTIEIANQKIQALSTGLDHEREHLKEERIKHDTLLSKIGLLEDEQSRSAKGKEAADKEKTALHERVSQHQVAIRGLEADAASRLTLLAQLETDRTFYNAERTCLLDQLMAESTRSHYVAENLPKDLAGLIGDGSDVRMFHWMQAGETVLVRAQRFLGERKALIIVEKNDHTKTAWYDLVEKSTVKFANGSWNMRLDRGSDEALLEIEVMSISPYDLEDWLNGSNPGELCESI